MPFQNRVTPLGELVATPERGLVYGNRGRLHDPEGTIRRPWQLKRWISCRLEFRGRRRAGGPMPPGRYTGLFFLDEATAFAAGHRPCAECRREDYVRFMELVGEKRAGAIDERLHAERFGPKPVRAVAQLPDGAFVLVAGEPWLVLGGELLRWTPGGYVERRRATGNAPLVTPPSVLRVLASGWGGVVPFLHPSASYKRDPRVDAYIASLPSWQQELCNRLRALVHSVDPEMTETVKRRDRPYFVLDGNVCALLAARDHLNLFLYDGGIVPDPAGLITGGHDNTTARTIAFREGETINAPALSALLAQIVANNRAGGWRKLKRG